MALKLNKNSGFYRQGASHAQITRSTFLLRAEGGEKVPELSSQVGISCSTGYRWLREYQQEGRVQPRARGGSDPTQFTEAKLYQFVHFLARRQADGLPFGRYKQLASQLKQETAGAIDWDARQVSRAVELVGFSQHGYTVVAAQRNTPHNTVRTAEFLEFRANTDPSKFAFYDESAWEMDKTGLPKVGIGPVGRRILRHELYKFFEQSKLALRGTTVEYIQMDNASFHDENVVGIIRDSINANGDYLEVVFQPTYSPHLQPCELVFGHVKTTAASDVELLKTQPIMAIQQAIAELSPHVLKQYARHSGVIC